VDIDTGFGAAAAELDRLDRARFLMVLTHGAGGGVDSADVLAARAAAIAAGGAVARVLQPYVVRGARAPGSPERQDAAWLEIIAALRTTFGDIPLIQGGRSNGARVACRTARAAGASGVVALAFPLHPPGRPERSRAEELRAAGTSVLVINGSRDPFGIPDPADATKVVVLAGETHALRGSSGQVTEEVGAWLSGVLGLARDERDSRLSGRRAGGAGVAGPGGRGQGPGERVRRPVRLDREPVGEQFSGVLEYDDAVTEQTPALLGVADDRPGRLAVQVLGTRARWRMWAHSCASCELLVVFLITPSCVLDHTLLCQRACFSRHGPL
jgi:hypothetical protein